MNDRDGGLVIAFVSEGKKLSLKKAEKVSRPYSQRPQDRHRSYSSLLLRVALTPSEPTVPAVTKPSSGIQAAVSPGIESQVLEA